MYPAHLVRVSDAEREAVVAQLSTATAEGYAVAGSVLGAFGVLMPTLAWLVFMVVGM